MACTCYRVTVTDRTSDWVVICSPVTDFLITPWVCDMESCYLHSRHVGDGSRWAWLQVEQILAGIGARKGQTCVFPCIYSFIHVCAIADDGPDEEQRPAGAVTGPPRVATRKPSSTCGLGSVGYRWDVQARGARGDDGRGRRQPGGIANVFPGPPGRQGRLNLGAAH